MIEQKKPILLLVASVLTATLVVNSANAQYDKNGEDLFGLHGCGTWMKYILKPETFLRKVANYYHIDQELVLKQSGEINWNSPEANERPLRWTVWELRNLFEKNKCRKRFYCVIQDYYEKHPEENNASIRKQIADLKQAGFFANCRGYEARINSCELTLTEEFRDLFADV